MPSEEDLRWARRNLRSEPGYEELGEAFDYIKKIGPGGAPLLDDLLPFLEKDGLDWDLTCVAAVEAVCAIGPKAAGAVPAIARLALGNEIVDPDTGRILTMCQKTAEFEISKIGLAAFPYLDRVPEFRGLLFSLAFDREKELLARLRSGGPDMEAAAVTMAFSDPAIEGVREALIEGHRAGHIGDAIFLRAIQELSDRNILKIAVPLGAFEPIVAGIAVNSADGAAKADATRMLKLFPHYAPGFGGPPLYSLRLPPVDQETAAPVGTPPKPVPQPTPSPHGAPDEPRRPGLDGETLLVSPALREVQSAG